MDIRPRRLTGEILDIKDLILFLSVPPSDAERNPIYQWEGYAGTGILLNNEGYVLTTSHSVHDRPVEKATISLSAMPFWGVSPFNGIRVVEDLEDYELAIIQTSFKSSMMRIKPKIPQTFNYSHGTSLKLITSRYMRESIADDGTITSNDKYNLLKPRHEDTFRTSHLVTWGDSGSPVFTHDYGELVGIAFGKTKGGVTVGEDFPPQFGYAVCTKLANPDVSARLGKYL